jgi:hypothetical protein
MVRKCVPFECLAEVSRFFAGHQLLISNYWLSARGVSAEGVYDYPKDSAKLAQALEDGAVRDLTLYSTLACNGSSESWRGMASFEVTRGMVFVGIDESIMSQPALLLRQALAACQIVSGIQYGIAYKRAMARGPDAYAAGVGVCSLSDTFSDETEQRRLTAWLNERQGEKRYLTGLFRGAYPASILSERHVELLQDATRQVHGGIGHLVCIGNGLWLWELSAPEIARAEVILRNNGLLVQGDKP